MRNLCFVLSAGALWGIISIFVSQLQAAGLTSMEVVAVRAVSAAFFLFLWILARGVRRLKLSARDLLWFLGMGIGSIVCFNYCYFEAIELVGGAAVPALLLYTAPAFVMLLSALLFHERLTRQKVLALVVIFFGLALVTGAFGGGQAVTPLAVLFGLGSGFGYALYSIFGKFVAGRYAPDIITFYTFLIAAIAAVPLSGISAHASLLLSWEPLLLSAGLGLLCTVLPFLFYTIGLSGMEAGSASLAATIEPVVAALVGIVYFGEHFTISEGIGIFLVLAAIVGMQLHNYDK